MRITVKIGDIEVTVDRTDFKETIYLEKDEQLFKVAVLPVIIEAVEKAKELYKFKIENTI